MNVFLKKKRLNLLKKAITSVVLSSSMFTSGSQISSAVKFFSFSDSCLDSSRRGYQPKRYIMWSVKNDLNNVVGEHLIDDEYKGYQICPIKAVRDINGEPTVISPCEGKEPHSHKGNFVCYYNLRDDDLVVYGSGELTSDIFDGRWYLKEFVKRVHLIGNINSIGASVFRECPNLEFISLPKSRKLKKIGENAFSCCRKLRFIENFGSVEEIQSMAFYLCDSLLKIDSFRSIKTIGPFAFQGCRYLTSIEFTGSIKRIENFAFSFCLNLVNVIFPPSVEITQVLGGKAFYECINLIDPLFKKYANCNNLDFLVKA